MLHRHIDEKIKQKRMIITTSWDDGHPLDFKVAELLSKYDLKGTFYIPQNNPEHRILDKKGIKTLSQIYEIGGHTLNHVNLLDVDLVRGENEIRGCKLWLEDALGKQIKAFCYPRGKFNKDYK
jgi:peptidoglycan/xylan/chitin deacetylase (PgdA/CDA1 family)